MRTIDMKLLAGEKGNITMMELRKSPGDVLLQVQMGKIINITKCGKVIAVLSPPEPTALEIGGEIRRLRLQGA